MKPARKIPLNYRNITGYIQSDKSSDYTCFESSLERDALILAEFNDNVLSFKSQPKRFYYQHNGKQRHYTPDILIKYKDGVELYVEVKYREDLKKDWIKLKPKFKAVIKSLKHEKNKRFKIWTEVEIRTPYFNNISFLLPYKKRKVEEYQVQTIIKIVSRSFNLTPRELLELCSSDLQIQAEFINSLWYCIAHGIVKVDLLTPMSMNSEIWIDSSNVKELLRGRK